MQIQKGLVKYKDRTDIVCTYAIMDDGTQYYFLDGNTITNGNIIASTVLVEAIDPVVVASSIGVIDSDGNVVIPFENRSIKPVADGLLLVERANSTTPSVLEAVKLRSDPLAATRLVTTPAAIKDNIYARMGGEGRFIFNDQFSEATICDIDGNNLINNEYFSFIAIKNNEILYFSKNVVGSPVMEFSLISGELVSSEDSDVESADTPLDIQSAEVSKETIDGAMGEDNKASFGDGDITAADFENEVSDKQTVSTKEETSTDSVDNDDVAEEPITEEGSDNSDSVAEEPITEGIAESTEGNNSDSNNDGDSDVNSEVSEDDSYQQSMNEEHSYNGFSADVVAGDIPVAVVENTDENIDNVTEKATNIVEDDENSEEEGTSEEDGGSTDAASVELENDSKQVAVDENFENVDDKAAEAPVNDAIVASDNKSNELVEFDFGDNVNYGGMKDNGLDVPTVDDDIEDVIPNFDKDLFDVDLETDIFADSVLHADKIIDDNFSESNFKSLGPKDTIIEDVASTMSNLINLNRAQRQKLDVYEDRFEQVAAAHKRVVEKARGQIRELEVLKTKVKNYETIVAKLEGKIQALEGRVQEQDRIISSQSGELETLRPQVESKKELAKILADAQSFLDQAV